MSQVSHCHFLLPLGIGIEIKVKGSPSAVIEQLIAYAELASIDALILVTARLRLGDLPAALSGKPVYSIPLWQNGL